MAVRKTIRISEEINRRIINLVEHGGYVTQNEIIRVALIKGLKIMEDEG